MTEKKKSWDDIPSIDNLEIDWDFKPESPLGRREYVRLTAKDLYRIFEKTEYPIDIKSGSIWVTGSLMDLSEGGMSVKSDKEFQIWQEVLIRLELWEKSIVSNGVVKMARKIDDGFLLGIQFDWLPKKTKSSIKEMYPAAKILR